MGTVREPLLTCYDYGQGAVWLLMEAACAEDVESAYPYLKAFSSAPPWMKPTEERQLRRDLEAKGFRWSVAAEPSGWLLAAAQEQQSPTMPVEIERELAGVGTSLANAGFKLVRVFGPASFGNYFATFAKDRLAITVARDRGQFIVSGLPKAELEAAGLWRTFSGAKGVAVALEAWLGRGDA